MLRRLPRKAAVGVLGFIAGSLAVGILLGPASATSPSASAASTPPSPPVFSVTGTVNANQGTPGSQPWPVTGTLGVSNLPSTQQVSGTVGVNNFPSTQQVSGTVGVNNFPSTQQVSGTVGVNNFPSTQQVSGTVTADQGTTPWIVTEAEPNAMFDSGSVQLQSLTQIAEPPAARDLIIQSVHVEALCAGITQCEVDLILGQPSGASTCTTSNEIVDNVLIQPTATLSGSPPQLISQPSQTLYVLPYSPGLLIPSGCALSAIGVNTQASGPYTATVSAIGYEVSA